MDAHSDDGGTIILNDEAIFFLITFSPDTELCPSDSFSASMQRDFFCFLLGHGRRKQMLSTSHTDYAFPKI